MITRRARNWTDAPRSASRARCGFQLYIEGVPIRSAAEVAPDQRGSRKRSSRRVNDTSTAEPTTRSRNSRIGRSRMVEADRLSIGLYASAALE